MATRFNAPHWRHDAYTLRKLASAIVDCIGRTQTSGILLKNTTVVDLGCGEAPYKSLLTGQGAHYIGCDIEPGETVDQIIDADGTTTLPERSVQCVTSFQVLEHVWDLDRYLGECRRLLAEDGLLILSTHGNWLYHPHPTDFRRWTLDGLQRELTSRGFSVIETWPIVGPLAWTTQFRTLAYHHVLKKLGPVGKLLSGILCLGMYLRMTLEDKLTPQTLIQKNAAVYLILAQPQKI